MLKERTKNSQKCILLVTGLIVLMALAPAALAQRVVLVDDDGAQCPGAVATIQEAVERASAGTTILVCPGTYFGTVNVSGSGKSGIQLMAVGPADGVVLTTKNDSDCNGFSLSEVSGVLIRGFTVKDFRCAPSTPSAFGAGISIRLENADFNTIEYNRLSNTGMFGVRMVNASNNLIQSNTISSIDGIGFGCAIMTSGASTAKNLFRNNSIFDTPGAALMIHDGTENVIIGNDLYNNGRYGVELLNEKGTRVEGNRIVSSPGYWGLSPAGTPGSLDARAVSATTSSGLTIRLNNITGNAGLDIFWDGEGQQTFSDNSCGTANQPKLCNKQVGCAAGSRCAAQERAWPDYSMM
jgi:parallel beta-helix repeat protein